MMTFPTLHEAEVECEHLKFACSRLHREVDHLQVTDESLRAEVLRLEAENDGLRAENERLKIQIEDAMAILRRGMDTLH